MGEDLRPHPRLSASSNPNCAEPKAGFTPAVNQPSTSKHLQASRLTGGGSAGEDLRPNPRLLPVAARFPDVVGASKGKRLDGGARVHGGARWHAAAVRYKEVRHIVRSVEGVRH